MGRDWTKTVALIVAIVALTNVVILDYVVGSTDSMGEQESRLEEIEDRIDRLSATMEALSEYESTGSYSEMPNPTPTPVVAETTEIAQKQIVVEKVVQSAAAPQVKEFYIPLGLASLRTENYTFQSTGAEAVLDLSNYPGVYDVRFEATLSVESGHVETRLVNVTDGNPLIESTLVAHGPTPKLYRSGNIVLPSGSKTYRVEMRTSLNFIANMDAGRIRILVQ